MFKGLDTWDTWRLEGISPKTNEALSNGGSYELKQWSKINEIIMNKDCPQKKKWDLKMTFEKKSRI